MAVLVLKFGGAAVADIGKIKNAAAKVAHEAQRGHKVVVVVAAMAGVTDDLIGYCRSVTPRPNPRELDAVMATGEAISSGLMAIALEQRGLVARSWRGWQVPIRTDRVFTRASILDIDTTRLHARLEEGEIAVLAGFQGVADDQSVTTLGRGGSDTSAVALAMALKADRCDMYGEAEGLFTASPRLVSRARKLSLVSYEEMLELTPLGAGVLQPRAVELARRFRVPLQVLSAFGNASGSDLQGTLVTDEERIMEQKPITGIAHSRAQTAITLTGLPQAPGVAARIFDPLARAGINVDMIVFGGGGDGTLLLTLASPDALRAAEVLGGARAQIGFKTIETDANVAKITLVGFGMRGRPGIAALMFETLAGKGINIQAVETSEISVSILVAEDYLELALRALHTAFDLDREESPQTKS